MIFVRTSFQRINKEWPGFFSVFPSFVLLAVLILSSTVAFGGQDQQTASDVLSNIQWQVEVNPDPDAAQNVAGGSYRSAPSRLQKNLTATDGANQGQPAVNTLTGSGLQALREFLFASKALGHSGILSGASSMTLSGKVTKGQLMTVALEVNPSTGYNWQASIPGSSKLVLLQEKPVLQGRSGTYGAPMVQYVVLKADDDGDGTVKLAYRRSFGGAERSIANVTINSGTLPETIDLTNPTPVTAAPKNISRASTGAPRLSADPLPSFFDWRENGGVSKVKDQKACGSCWAFATNGVLESSLKMKYGIEFDVSEQFLVSCNEDGWSCSGGQWAHDYHLNLGNADAKLGQLQTIYGAVLEKDMKYKGAEEACKTVGNHVFWIDSWGSATMDLSDSAHVDQIKQLIYVNGPVGASVCAGTAFTDYKSGVFDTDETDQCAGTANHAVLLVGWDDVRQTWILKNSWGPRWGDNGYMEMKWGISLIGSDVSYVSNPTVNCTYTITPEEKTVKQNGGTVTIKVTSTALCPAPQVALGDQTGFPSPWVSIASQTWQNQKGIIKLQIEKNDVSSLSRTLGVTIGTNATNGGEQFSLRQSGSPCTVKINPISQSFTTAGGSSSFGVTVNLADCQWTVGNVFDYWLNANSSGDGSGLVDYTVGANNTGKARSAKITVSLGQNSKKKATFTVKQSN